jgi:hypothetical protein
VDACFDRSLAVGRPVLMGRRMVPFSLGHARLLFAMRSPLVDAADRPSTIDDAIAAAYLCSMPWTAAQRVILDPNRVARDCRRWGRRCGPDGLASEACAVRQWLVESMSIPEAWQRPEAMAHDPGIPWPWLVAWMIKARVPNPWDIPCVEAMSWYCAACAEQGTQFQTEAQKAAAAGVVVTPKEAA